MSVGAGMGGAAGGCDAALDGHVLASGGGGSRRALAEPAVVAARGALLCDSTRLPAVGFGAAVDFFAASATTASVSCTGRSGTAVVGTGATGAVADVAVTGGDIAAAGVGTVFCRVAR